LNLDKSLLLNIFHIPSPSFKEQKMIAFVENFLNKYEISYEKDKEGNLFSFREGLPLLSAHLDTVQDIDDANLASLIEIYKDEIIKGVGIIGGDDKCGIYIILEILRAKKYEVNFAFTVQEEVGSRGSQFLCKNKAKELKKCTYGLIIDRRGSGDIICFDNDYGTIEFEETLEKIGKEYGYQPDIGLYSDADNYNKFMSCANLSAGYYNAHSKGEYVVLSQLKNTMDYVENIIKNVHERFKQPESKYFYKGATGRRGKTTTERYYNQYDNVYDSWYDEYDKEIAEYLSIEDALNKPRVCSICGDEFEEVYYVETIDQYMCKNCLVNLIDNILKIDSNLIYNVIELE